MTETPRDHDKIWQPLHPAIRDKLDPQYVEYHEKYLQYVIPDELNVWDKSVRVPGALPPGGTRPVPVGSIDDYPVGRFFVRAYTPTGEGDERGWPVLVWFHGGGWAVGGLSNGRDLCSWICQGARCVVVSVDYGLAPENPFPTAVEDSIDAIRWVSSSPAELGKIDVARISVGGTSSGGNLAVIATLAALDQNVSLPSAKPRLPNTIIHPPASVLLFVPVIDNTATAEDVWKPSAETAPWLTAKRLEWYRELYFTSDEHRHRWDASPNYAPETLLRKFPRTWMAVSELDLLAPEALAFGQQLRGLGVDAETIVVKGGTHSILSLHGRIDRGRKMIEDAVKHLQGVFGT
ncbi:Alpha/Beta hydrolase protein [Dactylonectria estremocensis]|uniref:Alpha/Beta hydrolase protein n=1 Tax=Dactylonectria estremocensis TaxID=1079267 RepID=A0A9P9FCD5_9HYPO|nr:Alpha/Beta hydrolase protein [Dactylonectria estremocensis]